MVLVEWIDISRLALQSFNFLATSGANSRLDPRVSTSIKMLYVMEFRYFWRLDTLEVAAYLLFLISHELFEDLITNLFASLFRND